MSDKDNKTSRLAEFKKQADAFRSKPETIRTVKDCIISLLDVRENELVVYKSDETLNTLSSSNPGLFEQIVALRKSSIDVSEAISRIKALQGLATREEIDNASRELLIDRIKVVMPVISEKPIYEDTVINVSGCKASNESILYIESGKTTTVTAKCILTSTGTAIGSSRMKISRMAKKKAQFYSQGPATRDSKNIVTKSVNLNELIISANIDLDDIYDVETLDKIMDTIQYAQYHANNAAFSVYKGSQYAEQILLENLLVVNKSLAEDMFKTVYESEYGEIDLKDADSVDKFVAMEKMYKKKLSTLYKLPVASTKADFGVFAQSKSIDQILKWTNIKKSGRVKINKTGSYYVANNIDTGCYTIQLSDSYRGEFFTLAGLLMPVAVQWLNNEVLVKLGLEPEEIDTSFLSKYSITESEASQTIAKILGLDDSPIANLEREQAVRETFLKAATTIVKNVRTEDQLKRSESASEDLINLIEGTLEAK